MKSKPATYSQMKRLLEDADKLLEVLSLSDASFMIPTDGVGLRIHVSALKEECEPGNYHREVATPDGETLRVLFEISDDFKPIEPLTIEADPSTEE